MTKPMPAAKSAIQDAANAERIRKLRANGHQFEFTIRRDAKGLFCVGLHMWHRNDTKRLVPTYAYLARFFNAAAAKAYEGEIVA